MNFQHIIYQAVLAPRSESPDGETPDMLTLTEERNGYALFRTNFDSCELVRWFFAGRRNEAIEAAVQVAMQLRGATTEA